jgi:hypothetical protein
MNNPVIGSIYPGSAGCVVATTDDLFWASFVSLGVVEGGKLYQLHPFYVF